MEITPHTKVGALLDAHPDLEDVLIKAVPAFVKLKNPILRATVAKFATLEQAARVGDIPLPELISLLRKALGQENPGMAEVAASAVATTWPPWFREASVVTRLDVTSVLAEGGHPLSKVKQALNKIGRLDALLASAPTKMNSAFGNDSLSALTGGKPEAVKPAPVAAPSKGLLNSPPVKAAAIV